MLGGERRAGQDCAKYQGQAQAATTGGSCKLHHRSAQGWATRAMRKMGELTEETSHIFAQPSSGFLIVASGLGFKCFDCYGFSFI